MTVKVQKKKSKKTWGGSRPGSGPKKARGKYCKDPITNYIERRMIDALGGRDATRDIMFEAVVSRFGEVEKGEK
jgi:hypothetical protein